MRLVLFAAALLTATGAAAQLMPGNSSPNFVFGEIPSAAQWNQGFSTKFDFAGGLVGGPLGLPASTPETIVSPAGRSPARAALWVCRCQCGAVRTVRADNLKNGNSRSCRCLQAENLAARNRRVAA
jgi:hypothetical protein